MYRRGATQLTLSMMLVSTSGAYELKDPSKKLSISAGLRLGVSGARLTISPCACSVLKTVRKAESSGVARPLSTERSMPSKPYLALSSAYLVRVRRWGWG